MVGETKLPGTQSLHDTNYSVYILPTPSEPGQALILSMKAAGKDL